MQSHVAAPQLRSFDQLLIGGLWVDATARDIIAVISPASEQIIGHVRAATSKDVDAAVATARTAFDYGPWPSLSSAERANALRRVAAEVETRAAEMAQASALELGAPIARAEAAHRGVAAMWRDTASLLEHMTVEQHRAWRASDALVVREPVGVVAVVIPWNGPVNAATIKIAPALAAGCAVILKVAPEAPVSVMILAEALEAAGLPPGLVSVLPADAQVSEYLVRHPGIDKVSFTGSTATGKRIMAICAETITRVSLELGGKSAGIVLADADLSSAVPALLSAGVGNSGQVCCAITRLLVADEIYDDFVARAAQFLESLRVGDPSDPATQLGPLVSSRQRERVESYIEIGRSEGARLVTGGRRPAELSTGWYVEPTLFADVDNTMRIAREEIFGPVIVAIRFRDVEEAIGLANDSDYGLSGSVWSADRAAAEHIARRVRTGQMFVNAAGMCLDQPFGGYKQSGLGREGGAEGIEGYFELKVIVSDAIDHVTAAAEPSGTVA
jgi:aldehyde dehydrogenase (NAD+)